MNNNYWELFELEKVTYDNWDKHFMEQKRKFNHRQNLPNLQKQEQAKECIRVLRDEVPEIWNVIACDRERITTSIRVCFELLQDNNLHNNLDVVRRAIEGDLDSIKKVLNLSLSKETKDEWLEMFLTNEIKANNQAQYNMHEATQDLDVLTEKDNRNQKNSLRNETIVNLESIQYSVKSIEKKINDNEYANILGVMFPFVAIGGRYITELLLRLWMHSELPFWVSLLIILFSLLLYVGCAWLLMPPSADVAKIQFVTTGIACVLCLVLFKELFVFFAIGSACLQCKICLEKL